ncbi:hypothetical protein F4803DRAFT_391777 [Xylaria telfairii]|nr:hypothetical protein F4803DRAFT_391777 [Xylaria telfairii]
MRKVHRPGPDPPAPRSRSDSFIRMLELEKMCKMRRIQQDQDHGSSTSTSNSPRAPFPSVTANPPAPRSRRPSDYPPLSHQTQIMKAVRRSAALPSLSLSIAPSPTQAMTMGSEGSIEEISLAKEERTKTVTFSEPEDEELSDDSSICQSPSWEQYGQKKKKKPKKGGDQKNTNDKEDVAVKRRSNRLTKSTRLDQFTAKPLTASDRSLSAPNLAFSVPSSKMNSPLLSSEAQVALGKRALTNELGITAKDKPRSRGFLSSFKLQHGNVAAAKKLVESRKTTEKTTEKSVEKSADEDEPLRSIQYETLPVQQPNATRSGNDRSRKPSSIRSVISTSDHSLSSQEKRSSGARTSTSSGVGRSQSLLSSTLNKLRGPSYLYYQPSGDESTNESSKDATNPQENGAMHSSPVDKKNEPTGKSARERRLADLEHPQQPFDFAFPSKDNGINTEPGPEIAPRARQPRPRKVDFQSPSFEQEVNGSRPPSSRRVQVDSPQLSTPDTVMALVTAQERRSQTARAAQKTRSKIIGGDEVPSPMKGRQNSGVGADGRITNSQNPRDEVNQSGSPHAVARNTSIAQRPNRRADKTALDSCQGDTVDMSDGHILEDDEISVGTHASTIRPVSRSHDGSVMESRRQHKLSRADISELYMHATTNGKLELQAQTIAGKSVDDLITFEKDMPDTLQQPLQPRREVDYFSAFTDSYLPPAFDLHSNNDGKLPSPRFPFSEESDEERGRGIVRDHVRNGHTKQTVVANEREKNEGHAVGSQPKGTGRISDEQKSKNSPAASIQYSDSDVPAFERLGLSSKDAKILVGTETASASTANSQQTDPSRTTSERSSSSVCDDSPPSPASTPDSSRPQSRKGVALSQLEPSHTTLLESVLQTEGKTSRKSFQGAIGERNGETASWRTKGNADVNGGSWSEVASPPNPEEQQTPTLARVRGSTFGPSLVASPTSVSFADVMQDLDEEDEQDLGQQPVRPLPPRAQSSLDLHSATKLLPRSSRPQRLQLKPNEMTSSVSLPSSPPADLTEGVMPRKSALKMSRNNSTTGSVGGAYLQEARKAAPVATAASSRALRPHFPQKLSSGSIRSAVSAGNRAEPLAKMLVECCNCHFFHDMPSRVYECMAKPDSVVEDKSLGVSAAISTMVRCPWCAHGMTTECCSGYAAVVYLKEKLHGK